MKHTLRRLRHVLGLNNALVLSIFLFGNAFVQVVCDLINKDLQLVFLAATGVFALVLAVRYDHQLTQQQDVKESASTSSYKGLIILVGLDSAEPHSSAIRLLKASSGFTHLAFLGTPQTAEKKVIRDIRDKVLPVIGKDLPSHKVFVSESGQALSLADFKNETLLALHWMATQGLLPQDVLIDTTAGRRAMGYGALEAANEYGVNVQYLNDQEDTALNDSQREFILINNTDK